MGACFSTTADLRQQTANVVSLTGDLHRFQTPVTTSSVLLHLSDTPSSFLANSDRLSYDEPIPAMKPDEELSDNQIYFVFPASDLHRRLSASEMAALAVKASSSKSSGVVSLSSPDPQQQSKNMKMNKNNNKNNKNKISPYTEPTSGSGGEEYYNYTTVKSGGRARVGSLGKLKRYSSRRAKLAVRSFRRTLSTIHEGSVTQFF